MLYDPLIDLAPKGVKWRGVNRPEKDDYTYWNGRLLIWEFPLTTCRYVLGVDPGQGVGGDNSVVQVIKAGTAEYPDQQVAEYACDFLSPVAFAEVVCAIGRMYHGLDDEALAVVELNSAGGGNTVQNDMRFKWGYQNLYIRKQTEAFEAGYEHRFGWVTTPQKRRMLVARGVHAFNSADLTVNSPFLLEEMKDFKPETQDRIAQAASGAKDDRVMALFMAHLGAHEDEWLSGENVSRQRRALTATTRVRENEHADLGQVPEWQHNHRISLEDMMGSWDGILDRFEE